MGRFKDAYNVLFNNKESQTVKKSYVGTANNLILQNWLNSYEGFDLTNCRGNKTAFLYSYRNLVARCIDARANNAAKSKPILYEMLNQTDKKEVIKTHPILSIIQNPSDDLTWYSMIYTTIMQQDLLGNCYWNIVRNQFGVPIGFRILPTHLVEIEVKDGFINGYKVKSGRNENLFFNKSEIIHFKYINPFVNSVYGIGIIESGSYEIDIYNSQKRYQKNLFDNDGRVAAVLQSKADINQEQINILKESWNSQYSSPENAGKIPVLPPDLEYKQIQNNPKEMDYTQSAKNSVDDILALFNIPRGIIGNSQDVNKSNAYETIKYFNDTVIKSLLQSFDEQLNKFIKNNFEGNLYLEHEPNVPKEIIYNKEFYVEMLKAGVLTIEEVRTAIGYL